MFVSHSEIAIEEEQVGVLEAAFRARARLVDSHDGFLGLELLREVGHRGRYVLVTRWRTREDFRRYMKSEDYRAAHVRERAGLEEASLGAPLRQFETVELQERRS
jgi:heme-degrading monooxygenase HmoA